MLNFPQFWQCSENNRSENELFTGVVLLDPGDAVLINLFRFLGQHGILQVCSVETHGKPENILDGMNEFNNIKKTNLKEILREIEAEVGHVHLRPSHIQLVEDVFLNTGGGGGCQGHHRHIGELLTQFMQPLVVWPEIVAPLKDFISQEDFQWLLQK